MESELPILSRKEVSTYSHTKFVHTMEFVTLYIFLEKGFGEGPPTLSRNAVSTHSSEASSPL